MAMVVSALFSSTHCTAFSRFPTSKLPNFIIRDYLNRRDSNKYRPQIVNLLGTNQPSVPFSSAFVLCTSIALSYSLLVANVSDASAFVVTTPRKLQTDELATVRLFQANTPSVVYITNLAVKMLLHWMCWRCLRDLDQVNVEILRGDHKVKIPVVLEPKPDET